MEGDFSLVKPSLIVGLCNILDILSNLWKTDNKYVNKIDYKIRLDQRIFTVCDEVNCKNTPLRH